MGVIGGGNWGLWFRPRSPAAGAFEAPYPVEKSDRVGECKSGKRPSRERAAVHRWCSASSSLACCCRGSGVSGHTPITLFTGFFSGRSSRRSGSNAHPRSSKRHCRGGESDCNRTLRRFHHGPGHGPHHGPTPALSSHGERTKGHGRSDCVRLQVGPGQAKDGEGRLYI